MPKSLKILLQVLLSLAILWGFYLELFRHKDFVQIWHLFTQQLAGAQVHYLWLVVLLMPGNWLLETLKWRQFTQPWSGLRFGQSLQAVLAGVAASMLLPNRSGDYLGRWILTPKGIKTKLLLATLAGNYCQFMVLLGLGLPAFLWLGHYLPGAVFDAVDGFLPWVMLAFFLLLWSGIVLIPWLLQRYSELVRGGSWTKLKGLQRLLVQILDLIDTYRWATFARGLGLAALRYLLYSMQYYAILRFFGIVLPLDAALAGVGSIYLLQTAIPLPPVLGLLARGEIALLIWGIWGANALSSLAASYSLFVLNLVIPALLGLFLIVKKW
jgi:hypothetical protein